jgi:undecaprenyl-diphosphatase
VARVSLIEAALLGVLQGLGEFLPISSSGHLIAVPWLLGWGEHGLAFDVALHIGTLVAVLYAFAGDWRRMAAASWRDLREHRRLQSPDARLLGLLALATLPGGVAGLLLDEWAETTFRSPALVAVSLALLGVCLGLADRFGTGERTTATLPLSHAMLIGAAQALALIPGVSRSGATISAALLLGYRREEAARFSFLLATPITVGAGMLKLPDLATGDASLGAVLVGVVAAGVVGLLAIRWLLRYVRTRSYMPFVVYRLVAAALLGGLLLARG